MCLAHKGADHNQDEQNYPSIQRMVPIWQITFRNAHGKANESIGFALGCFCHMTAPFKASFLSGKQ